MSCFFPNPNPNPSPLKEKIQILIQIQIQIHKKSLNPAFQVQIQIHATLCSVHKDTWKRGKYCVTRMM